ncbi:hypothetical protein B0H10DRAFT_2174374 [Mycena sp. CBHHK59/15]|nr:hypothetical protein B0H10DRAFT_2174374 [Mycena sp. CBHHK59/15]
MAQSYTPSHADFVVEFKPGNFTSFLKTASVFSAGDTLTFLSNLTRSRKSYSTVQSGKVNNSCEPNIAFDLSSPDPTKWHIRALKDIDAESPQMDQAFDCQCGAKTCAGQVLDRGWVNPWILELMERKYDYYKRDCDASQQ